MKKRPISRRQFMQLTAASAAGMALLPGFTFAGDRIPAPLKRTFGKTGFKVTTLGLGGQASIQWTPEDVDPVAIILKAFKLGVNYFDTSNLYGPSQLNYHKAFEKMNLIPGRKGYDEGLRKSIFLTTKTHIRWGKGGFINSDAVGNWTNGDPAAGAVGDLRRSLSQMFGDGEGNYPKGAYVDMVLIHSLNTTEEVDVLYIGLETPLVPEENFGALVALRDFRDGTNHTGLNPDHEKLIRHIGFSGHRSAPVMMEMIRRDEYGILDAMLVAINANDRNMLNMQYNVIEVAAAKNMGIIAMKVFADGAMYTKEARWSRTPEDVVRSVGSEALPSRPLVEYSLTTPGVHTAIIGIGQIDDDPLKCQLVQNFYSAQIKPDALSQQDRRKIEEMAGRVKDGATNYFQLPKQDLTAPVRAEVLRDKGVELRWDTAIAGDEPLVGYEIMRDGKLIATVPHRPQTTTEPFRYSDTGEGREYRIVSVDAAGRKAASEALS
ncbi:MAG: aldo/keto reductase [Bacteroidota bacterium]